MNDIVEPLNKEFDKLDKAIDIALNCLSTPSRRALYLLTAMSTCSLDEFAAVYQPKLGHIADQLRKVILEEILESSRL
jgi:hypothetical protein